MDERRDFVKSAARGLAVINAFGSDHRSLSVGEIASTASIPRPTVHRLLHTLVELGYVRERKGSYELTAKILELGMSYIQSQGIWDIARPHMEHLVAQTGESSSIAQLDGSDIVYVARVAVPKIIAIRVQIGTRFPAVQASLGQVLLAELETDELDETLAQPSASQVTPLWQPDRQELDEVLAKVRASGYALADEVLASGIRSVAVPLRNGAGDVVASMNVTCHAAETPLETVTQHHLPLLREAAAAISTDIALTERIPLVEVEQ